MNDQQIHEHISAKRTEAELLLRREVFVAYRGDGVSVSGWIGPRFETVTSPFFDESVEMFRAMVDEASPKALRKQAAELLAKADAMEAGK